MTRDGNARGESSSLEGRARQLLRAHARTLSPETLGRGSDPYSPSGRGPYWFAMALGLYLGGLARISSRNVPGRRRLIDAAVARLAALRNEEGVWGLPFAWKGSSPESASTITTAIAASGLLHAARCGRPRDWEPHLLHALRWLSAGVPWSEHERGACPWFGREWPLAVTNVAAKVGGLLMEAGREFGLPDCIARASSAAEFVCDQQLLSGAWLYGLPDARSPRSTQVVDLAHTCYTLEGLFQIYAGREALPDALAGAVDVAIRRGLEFANRSLCGPEGLREKVWILSGEELAEMHARASTTRAWHSRRNSDGTHTVLHPEAPRLWSLGAFLSLEACARRDRRPGVRDVEGVLSRIERLSSREGRFRYRTGNRHLYVRHEAHVFAGLMDFLESSERD